MQINNHSIQKINWEKYSESRLLGRNRLTLEHHQEVLLDFIEFFSTQPNDLKIVDIGCAAGFFLTLLRELGFQKIFGFDISENFVEQAKLKGLNCQVADVLNKKTGAIPQTFDLVLMMDLLEHFENPSGALETIRKNVLRPNGMIFITIPIYDSIAEKIVRIIRRKPKLLQAVEHDPTHVQAFSQSGFEAILKSAGFRILESKRFYCRLPKMFNIKSRLIINELLPQAVKGTFLRVTATPENGQPIII
jgi:2-polyprenyl-3-methyl-5-hydroxy-6-metoxy-1,4-benzoquinol methylase